MHRAIVIAAVIGLVGGIAGAWAVGQLSGSAGAAPPPPQAREDQITIASGQGALSDGSYTDRPAMQVALDS